MGILEVFKFNKVRSVLQSLLLILALGVAQECFDELRFLISNHLKLNYPLRTSDIDWLLKQERIKEDPDFIKLLQQERNNTFDYKLLSLYHSHLESNDDLSCPSSRSRLRPGAHSSRLARPR